MARYIVAIDQGTTGTTILLIDELGRTVHKSYQALPQHYPKPGWVEHDPEQIWDTVRSGLNEILALAWLKPAAIAAVGLTNQRETVVVWERETGRPVYPAIVWQCRRTAAACKRLSQAGMEPELRYKTGLRLDPYFSATKIHWLLENVPGLAHRAEQGDIVCGTIDAWLIWKLTGGQVHATDYSNASRTLLFNIHTLAWDTDLLRCFEIPAAMLPEVKPSAGFFGRTDPGLTGGTAIPITGVLGDQQAALLGHGCLEPGSMKNTYGTGCFLLMNTGSECQPPPDGLLTTIAWGRNGSVSYALEGSVFNGGTVVQWLRDELGILKQAADSEAMAQAVPDTGGVYFVPAFTGTGAPDWDPQARGLIIGLTRGTNRNHLVRAALEGIAFQVKEVIDAMGAAAGSPPTQLRVDGGGAANDFLLQFQADISRLTIQRNRSVELTGTGVAFLAGLAAGFWKSPAELADLVQLERSFLPRMGDEEREQKFRDWRRAVSRSAQWSPE